MSIKYKGKTISSGGAAVLTTDETLFEDKGVLGVSTPVNGVISQKDFDALPEKQQNHGVYFIPDAGGGSSCSSQEVYSTKETRIGTWIDGEPLYREVIEKRNFEGRGQIVIGNDIYESLGIASITNIYGIIGVEGQKNANPLQRGYSGYEISCYVNGSGDLVLYNTALSGKMYAFIILEYTKTTDEVKS